MSSNRIIYLQLFLVLTSTLSLTSLYRNTSYLQEFNGVFNFSDHGYMAYLFEPDYFDTTMVVQKRDLKTNRYTNFTQDFIDIGCTKRPHFQNNSKMYCVSEKTKEFLVINPSLPLKVIKKYPLKFFDQQYDWLDDLTGYLTNLGYDKESKIYNWTIYNTSSHSFLPEFIFNTTKYAPSGYKIGGYEITPDFIYPFCLDQNSSNPIWYEFDLHNISRGLVRKIPFKLPKIHHTNIIMEKVVLTLGKKSIYAIPLDGSKHQQWVTNDTNANFNRLNLTHFSYAYQGTIGVYTLDEDYKFVCIAKTNISKYYPENTKFTITPPKYFRAERFLDIIVNNGKIDTYFEFDMIESNITNIGILYPQELENHQYFPVVYTKNNQSITPSKNGLLIQSKKDGYKSISNHFASYFYDIDNDKIVGFSQKSKKIIAISHKDASISKSSSIDFSEKNIKNSDIRLLNVDEKLKNAIYYIKSSQSIITAINGKTNSIKLSFNKSREVKVGGFINDKKFWIISKKKQGSLMISIFDAQGDMVIEKKLSSQSIVAYAGDNTVLYTDKKHGAKQVSFFNVTNLKVIKTVSIKISGYEGIAPLGNGRLGFVLFGKSLFKAFNMEGKKIKTPLKLNDGNVFAQATSSGQLSVITYNQGIQFVDILEIDNNKVKKVNKRKNGRVKLSDNEEDEGFMVLVD